MKFHTHDIDNEIFIVAEIGNNHEGDLKVAEELIKEAALSKVDAVKFQTFIPENYVTSSDIKRIETLKRFQFSRDEFIYLSKLANQLGLLFFSTPFDIKSAHFLNQIQPIFKISSGDNNFFPLIDEIFKFNKPTIISTGLADFDLLDKLYEKWNRENPALQLSFLHCVTSYPVPDNEANIKRISELKNRFPEAIIGYSDHTLGIETACLAASLGARIIEKHFTLDKNYSNFRDHQLSSDPNELKNLVERIRKIENLLDPINNTLSNSQESNRVAVRRSIAASRDIKNDKQILPKDLIWLRPGNGFPPGKENLIVGKRSKRFIKKGEIIFPEMID